jgi:glycosyltransferase involved in cell wall biosynthesis
MKKIAIFHTFLDNIGGAEIVALCLAHELDADIYTTNINAGRIKKMGFGDVLPRIHSIGKVPLNAPFRQQITLWRFRRLNLGRFYDFYFINGEWAISGATNNKPNIWYVNNMIREIWDLYEYNKINSVSRHLWPIFDLWVSYNRYLNRRYSNKIDAIISNSIFTKDRVKKFLNKDSTVIYPPTKTSEFEYRPPRGYWLAVNRLISQKMVDLQLRAFARLPKEKLIIVGSYEKDRRSLAYEKLCRKIKPANVEILNWVSQEKVIDLYSSCIGFVTTSKEEDFGMTAVEAMASGKPVIAPNSGGYKESVISGITGVLIDNIDEDKLIAAIKAIGKNPESYKDACLAQARKFDTAVFIERIKRRIGLI